MGGPFKKMTGALFPGQGSEREGMLSLIKTDFQRYLKEDLYIPSQTLKTKPDAFSEVSIQIGIYAVSASFWEDSKRDYIFSLIAGHSLGFYSALFASGSIDFETGIYLIKAAHRAISDIAGRGSFGMTAIIGIKWDIIDSLCKGYEDLYVANINSATQVVVSGAIDSLDSFEEMIVEKGALKISRLPLRYPLHTPILRGVSDIMREMVRDIELKSPEIPVVDHTTGEILASSEKLRETLIGQFSRRVIWRDVISGMRRYGVSRFVEVGPGDTLSKLTKWIERDAEAINLDVQA